jgi:predicted SnoaL-like aldol condensation-catalyzing enzyme
MSKQDNIAAQKYFGVAVNGGKLHEFNKLMTSNVKDHDPAPDQGPGPEGFIQFFSKFRKVFPDLEVAVDHMVADDNNVAIRLHGYRDAQRCFSRRARDGQEDQSARRSDCPL